MVNIDKILKTIFIISAFSFLIILVTEPKTNCQVCEIEYENKTIDGYEAFKIFEDGCIDYSKPYSNNIPKIYWDNKTKKYVYINLDDINYTVGKDGVPIINFKEGKNESG